MLVADDSLQAEFLLLTHGPVQSSLWRGSRGFREENRWNECHQLDSLPR